MQDLPIDSVTAPFQPSIAPDYDILSTEIVCVEHPCIVKDLDNGLKSLGGEQQIKNVMVHHYNAIPPSCKSHVLISRRLSAIMKQIPAHRTSLAEPKKLLLDCPSGPTIHLRRNYPLSQSRRQIIWSECPCPGEQAGSENVVLESNGSRIRDIRRPTEASLEMTYSDAYGTTRNSIRSR